MLLRLVQDAGFKGAIYHFGDTLSALAESIIIKDELTVYSWPPANRYPVPNGDGIAMVDEYLLGDRLVPVVSPVVEGEGCLHKYTQRYVRPFYYPHDITLIGYKKGETSEAVGISFPATQDIGVTTLVSPLFEWTDNDVYAACENLGMVFEDENDVELCNACLDAIINSDWDRQAALSNFRARFQFNH